MSKLNSPFFILHTAIDFFEKGTAAASDKFKIKEDQVPTFDSMIHPKLCMPAVNIMFSLELALKGLLKHSNRQLRSHDVLKLFKALDPEIRARIIDHYHSHDVYKKYIAIRLLEGDGTGHATKYYFMGPARSEEGVLELLDRHKRYFEIFRYLFEFDNSREHIFMFREMSNFTFSILVILGETMDISIVSKTKRRVPLIDVEK
jgi:hypothetical protein